MWILAFELEIIELRVFKYHNVRCDYKNSFKHATEGVQVDFDKNVDYILWSRDIMFWGLLL